MLVIGQRPLRQVESSEIRHVGKHSNRFAPGMGRIREYLVGVF